MKYKWLNRQDNQKLIIFFNGWGMDESVVKHLNPQDYDVIMFYDYNSLNIDLSIINGYAEKYLIAWSMGVMCASLFEIDYHKSTAINGTLKPIDNTFGIPEKIYSLTIKGFNLKSSEQFIQNMFLEKITLPEIKREFENQKTELIALKSYNSNLNFHYDRIIISDSDKIIPTKNQIAFWGVEPNLHSGHCPFFLFKSWSELL